MQPVLVIPELMDWIDAELGDLRVRQARHRKATRLAELLDAAYFRLNPHRAVERLMWKQRTGDLAHLSINYLRFNAVALSSRALRLALGWNSQEYKRVLRAFFLFDDGPASYESSVGCDGPRHGRRPPNRASRLYVLKPTVADKLTQCWGSPASGIVVDAHTGKRMRQSRFPRNGIVRTSYSSVVVPSAIQLDTERLNSTISEQEARLAEASGRLHPSAEQRAKLRVQELYRARKWLISLGGLPNLYADHRGRNRTRGTGRLYGIGGYHLQRVKREARTLILSGTGWFDYDFRACHPTILAAVAEANGLAMPTLRDWLTNRERWAEELSVYLEVPTRKIKRVMNSTLYGAPLSSYRRGALVQHIGRSGVQRLKCYGPYLDLRSEVITAAAAIVDRHTTGKYVINAVGKARLCTRSNASHRSSHGRIPTEHTRKLLSHVLTGYEAWALNATCSNIEGVVLLMHDGFVCRTPMNVLSVREQLRIESIKRFGFDLSLQLVVKHEFL